MKKKLLFGLGGVLFVAAVSLAFSVWRAMPSGLQIELTAKLDPTLSPAERRHPRDFAECEEQVGVILDEVNALQGALVTREQAALKSSDPLFQKTVELWYVDKYAAGPYDPVFKQCMIARGHGFYKEMTGVTYKRP